MTDDELVSGLCRSSENEALSDEDSDLVALAARVISKRAKAKLEMRAEHATATKALGRLFSKIGAF